MMKKSTWIHLWVMVGIVAISATLVLPVGAQNTPGPQPISMMIVLDNSCSMFPREMIVAGCTSFGSDVNFLRIKGAALFIARLGFDQENEEDYQLGVISLGEEPVVQSAIGPLVGNRDLIANRIADPEPQRATRLIPALQKAYLELRDSPAINSGNLPAVVLITDGVPYPAEGQSQEAIEKLLSENEDIPLFLMILKGAESNVEEFEEYVKFWQEMQILHDNVFVYLVETDTQIEATYNQIVATLQDTIPSRGRMVTPGVELPFFVGPYVDKVVLTISYPTGVKDGVAQVFDPLGKPVEEGEAGVAHFRGSQNPVEIFSISPPRLAEELTGEFWKVTSNYVATVFIDREGTYRINVLDPAVTATDLSNVYQVEDSLSARQPFPVQFNLLDDGQPVLEQQPIWVEVLSADNTPILPPTPVTAVPDDDGTYKVAFDLPGFYPYTSTEYSKFNFILHAGIAGEGEADNVPIATARLTADVGPRPFVQLVSPSRVDCTWDSAHGIVVTVGDYQSVLTDTLKVSVRSESGSVALEGQDGDFRGDLNLLCEPLLMGLACGEQSEATFQIELNAQLSSGQQLQPAFRDLNVGVISAACTPTPGPTAVAFIPPTPRPTQMPDTDLDGFNDLQDRCINQAGTELFNGCKPPYWFYLLGIVAVAGMVALFVGMIWPWISVKTIAKPPEAYILVCHKDIPAPEVIDVHKLGMRKRTSKIRIGSHPRKAQVCLPGLKPVELTVREKDGKIVILDQKGDTRLNVRQLTAEKLTTSNPEIKLWVAGKRSALEKIKC